MSITKLKIDLANQTIEAEGSEEFVKEAGREYAQLIKGAQTSPTPGSHTNETRQATTKKPKNGSHGFPSPKTIDKKKAQPIKRLEDINIFENPSIKDFYAQFEPKTLRDRISIVLQYFEDVREVEEVYIEHIFTGLDGLKIKTAPNFAKQCSNASRGGLFKLEKRQFFLTHKGRDHLSELKIEVAENG